MEVLAAAQTGLLLALFLGHLALSHRRRLHSRAGPLAGQTRRRSTIRGQVVLLGLSFLLGLWLVGDFVFSRDALARVPEGPLRVFAHAFAVCATAVFGLLWNRDLEERESGLILPMGLGRRLVEWNEIEYCQWLDRYDTLLIATRTGRFEVRLPVDIISVVVPVLCRHVELRIRDGCVVNPGRKTSLGAPSPKNVQRSGRLQFSLKTLLLLAVVAGSASVWLGVYLQAGWREQQILEERFDKSLPGVRYRGNRIDALVFSQSPEELTDDDLRHLVHFKQLRRLYLDKTQITDAGLAHVENLTSLRILTLRGTRVTGAGLVHLGKLTGLTALDLGSTRIADDDLAHLRDLTKLVGLFIGNTQVTDRGLYHLEGFKNLKVLDLPSDDRCVFPNPPPFPPAGQVTEKAVRRLQKKLPGTDIH